MSQSDQQNRPPTLKTIAYLTGFSVTAVSRALKDAPDIGETTKKQVRRVAEQIGYRPSRAALRLRTGKTQVISLILNVDEEIMGLTTHMVHGISKRLAHTNYHLVVIPFAGGEDPLSPVRYVVETGSADAVIISQIEPEDQRVRYLQEHNMPFATHGRTAAADSHAWVDYDNERFASESVALAARLRAKSLGLLSAPSRLTFARHLDRGLTQQASKFNIDTVPINGIMIDNNLDEIQAAICDLMRSDRRPDALVVAAGGATIAAAAGVEEAGLRIGTDVHLIAKQSTKILGWFRPEIHAFHEDVLETGSILADFCLRLLNGAEAGDLSHLLFENIHRD